QPSSDPQTWGMVFVAAVALVAIVIAVCRERQRTSGQNAAHILHGEELVMRERENVSPEEHGSGQSANYYMEVPDSPPPSDGSSAGDEPPPLPLHGRANSSDDYLVPEPTRDQTETPPPVCHGPGNLPDDYLNPEPSRDETEEEGTEWKTVPFYENTQIKNFEPTARHPHSEAQASHSDLCQETVVSAVGFHVGGASGDDTETENFNVQDEEGYVPYAPRLYENTMQ
ncbi:hypothetical protein BaRGS_00038535, partial [Batillaria attramentaria]